MSPFSSSSASTSDPITRELDTGERILWSGQPDPVYMGRKAIPLALLSVALEAFVFFWMWGAGDGIRSALAVGKTPDLFSLVFPALGLVLAVPIARMGLSPWTEPARARRTFYALTDRRALVVVEGSKKSVKSVLPAEFAIERRDLEQKGDVILKRETKSNGRNTNTVETGFFGIENAREAERVALELAQLAR